MSIRNALLAIGTTGRGGGWGGGSRILIHRVILSRTIQIKRGGNLKIIKRLSVMSFSLLVQLGKYENPLSVYEKCPFRCWYNRGI